MAVSQEGPGRCEGEQGEAGRGGAAPVGKQAQGHAERHQVRRDDEPEEPGEAEASVGEARKRREAQRRGQQADDGQRGVPEDRCADRVSALRLGEPGRLGLGLVVGPDRCGHAAESPRPPFPVVHGRRRLRDRGQEERPRLRGRVRGGLAEEQHAGMVVDGELLLGAVVGEAHRPERRVRGEVGRALEAEAAVEEGPVVRDRHREDGRDARHVHVDAPRGHRDPVGLGQSLDHDLDFLRRVRIEERNRGARVAAGVVLRHRHRLAVVPRLVGEGLSLRHVRINPAGGFDPGVRPTVDRRERDRPEKRGAQHRDGRRAGEPRHPGVRHPRGKGDSRQDGQRRVGGVEVPDRLDDRQAVVEEEEQDVDRQRGQCEDLPAEDRGEAPEERGDRAEPEGEPRAPQNEVLDGIEERAARPLQRGRETRHGARQDLEPPKVVDPARVELEREGARAEEDVGEEDADRRRRRDEEEQSARQGPQDRLKRAPAAERPDQDGDADGRKQREGRDLARGRQADRDPGQPVARRTGTILRDPDGAVERRRGERRQERVDGPEVRELDAEHAEGRQAGGQERGAPVRESPRDAIDQPDREEVEDPG